MAKRSDRMETLVSLSKRRGIVFPSSEIYGGLRASWDYGPLGVEMKPLPSPGWIGTPYCVTVDFETLEDQAVTVRERDSMKQERIGINGLTAYLSERMAGC